MDQPAPVPPPAPTPLSPQARAELIRFAQDGMARALNERIDSLEASGALQGKTLAAVRRAASTFDMAGVVASLQEEDRGPI